MTFGFHCERNGWLAFAAPSGSPMIIVLTLDESDGKLREALAQNDSQDDERHDNAAKPSE